MTDTADAELAFLLEAYQVGTPLLSEKFDALSRPMIRAWARKNGWGLPKDVIEEVVQEVFLALTNPATVRFDAGRGTAKEYLLGRLLNAVKTVQIANGLRRTGSDFEHEGQRVYIAVDDLELSSPNVIPIDAIHARQLVGKMFSGTEVGLKEACLRIWSEDESQSVVAADLGISRFALARKLATVKALSLSFVACA